MDDLWIEDLRRKVNFALDEAYNRGWKQGRNNVKPLIDEIHENVYNEGRQKGVSDTVDKAIELLKAYPLVKAMGEILKLKEQTE